MDKGKTKGNAEKNTKTQNQPAKAAAPAANATSDKASPPANVKKEQAQGAGKAQQSKALPPPAVKKEGKATTTPTTPTVAAAAQGKDALKKQGKDAKPAGKEQAKEATPEPRIEDFAENPYVEVLAHRQRALKKRLGKIEKNEEAKAQGIALNEDQLASISQKKEVQDLIRELDELLKHSCLVAVEQDKEAKKQAKLKKAEEYKQIQAAKEQQQEEFRQFLEVFFILNTFGLDDARVKFTSGQVKGFTLTQGQLNTLDKLNLALFPIYNPSQGLEKATKELQQKLLKLSSKGKEELFPGASCQKVHQLLHSISTSSYFNLEVAAKIAQEGAAAEAAARAAAKAAAEAEAAAAKAAAKAAAEAALREQEIHNSYEIVDPNEIPDPTPGSLEHINGQPEPTIAFMGESELGSGEAHAPAFDQGAGSVVMPSQQQRQQQHHQRGNNPWGNRPFQGQQQQHHDPSNQSHDQQQNQSERRPYVPRNPQNGGSEGGFRGGRGGGGYRPRDNNREPGYGNVREGGFGNNRDNNREGGFRNNRDGGNREGGYGNRENNREGGFGNNNNIQGFQKPNYQNNQNGERRLFNNNNNRQFNNNRPRGQSGGVQQPVDSQ